MLFQGKGGAGCSTAPFTFPFLPLLAGPGSGGLWVRGIWAACEGKRQFPSVLFKWLFSVLPPSSPEQAALVLNGFLLT